jgi:hypothetical protein
MTLPKEWIDKAKYEKEKYETSDVGFRTGYEHGATAYKQAVEKACNDKLTSLKILKDEAYHDYPHSHDMVNSKIDCLTELLTELQTLTPTSND